MSWSSIGRVRGRVELAGRGFACCRRLTLTFAFQFAMSALTAAAATASTPVTVSATLASPLSSCTADAISSQPRVNFANTEVEPYLAVNPTNPQNVVATWQQDRWSNGGARGNLVATSSDGGATWTVTTATKSSACAGGTSANGGDLPRATDPWLSFAPNGDLYLMSLSFENAVFTHQGDTGFKVDRRGTDLGRPCDADSRRLPARQRQERGHRRSARCPLRVRRLDALLVPER